MVNNRWARLSQNEKAELLGIYTSMGYNDLASIIAHYNSCGGKLKADGGPVTNTAQYKNDAYLYNPPVNVGAPIEVPLRYKPLPDYGDYVPQRTTGMLEDIPIEMELETPQRGYGVLMPDAPSVIPTLDARQDAARRIMAVENSKNNVNGGYDAKTGRWYPHKSHEGGADTIAYGIKLSNGTPEAALALKQGYLTDEQAESAVDSLVQKYYDAAKRVYDGRYGAGEWDKLSDKSQSILVDYSYNPGLAKFPKLMEGFHSGNLDLIRKNYKRYSGGKELGRNKVLLEELDTLENEYPIFRAEGGKIHIKPENRGKFTALKKRTGHSASWFKAHGTPAQKKMAVFALNAKKWKHGDGGPLNNYFEDGGPEKQNWFTRMAMNSVMNDPITGAVATASGWTRDKNGNVTQTEEAMNSEGATRLRNNLAVLGELTLGATAAGALSGAAATELGTYGNIYKNVGKRLLRDIPAFEFFDRLPTLFGDQRFTEYGAYKSEQAFRWLMPENRVTNAIAPYFGQIVGSFVGGAAPGIASDMAMNAGSRVISGGISRANKWIADQFNISESDAGKILSEIKKVNPDKERSISRAFTDKDKFRRLVDRLTTYESENGSYNVPAHSYWHSNYNNNRYVFPTYQGDPKLSDNAFIAALEKDLDTRALHEGFKYDNIYVAPDGFITGRRPTRYDPQRPSSFFDAAEDNGFDTAQLLDRYEDYVNLLTRPNEFRSVELPPSDLAERIGSGKLNVEDYRRVLPGNIVNEDGSINNKELIKAYRSVLENLEAAGYAPRGYNKRSTYHGINEKYHSSGKMSSLKDHVAGVVKTAQQIPVPKGSSRQELVRAALVHDIGKLVTGQEAAAPFARHPVLGEEFLRTMPELQEFSSQAIRSSVLMHMDDGVTPIYKSHGTGTLNSEHPFRIGLESEYPYDVDMIPEYDINYDLLHALQASDVARGLSYDQAATRFPQLFTYDKDVPFNVKLYEGTPEEQLKNVVNPLLRRQGYPTVKNAEQLQGVMERHRSFLRGVRDPYKPKTGPDADIDGSVAGLENYYPSGSLEDQRNAINAANQALRYYGENTPETRLLASEGIIPESSTGHGRASLFGVKRGNYSYTTDSGSVVNGEVTDNAPGLLSERLKVSPEYQDAMYVSASPSVLREYSNSWSNPRTGMAARVTIPNEPMRPGESLADFYERSNFQLYAGHTGSNDIASGTKPMSNFQMFEEPYRLQTGRSLQQDMAKEFEGKKLQKHSNSGFIEDEGLVEMMRNNRSRLVSIGEKFGIDFSKMYPEIQSPSGAKGVLGNIKAAGELDHVASLYERDGGTGLGLNMTGAEFLFKKGFISNKTLRTFKTLNRECFHAMENARHSTFLDAPEAEAAANKAKVKLSKFVNTYILNKNNLYKAKQAYFKEAKPDFKMSKEFTKYMHDPENIVKFMREKGVAPLYEMPSFGKSEVFSTNMQGWGWGPKTRSFAPSDNASQGIIIGNRGEKVLDVRPFTDEELQQLYSPLNVKFGRFRSGARDAGNRLLTEDERFAITRKTFNSGGSLREFDNISDIF